MELHFDAVVLAAAGLRQVNERSPLASAIRGGEKRPTVFGMIMVALHESRRRRSERLLLHDYRHLICRPNQESERVAHKSSA